MKSDKIKSFLSEKKNINIIYIIVIIGVALLCLPSFFESDNRPEAESEFINTESTEKEIEKILSEISGVGRCSVLITYKSTSEYVIAKDISRRDSDSGSDVEEKNIVVGSGSGEKPFVIKEEMPKIQGVVVVCQGGDGAKVKSEVSEAVCALCGIAPNKVKVFKK